jgi:hypothetical protein
VKPCPWPSTDWKQTSCRWVLLFHDYGGIGASAGR